MLPLSHDEVVHGKSPMVYKMPGDEWQKFANLRLLYTYMYTHPGAKLLFMGNEFGQTTEWNINSELDWELLQYDAHEKLQRCVKDLNHLYVRELALHELQFDKKGFEWVNLEMRHEGLIIYKRKGKSKEDDIVILLNVSNHFYYNKSIELKGKLQWKEIFNSNNLSYWGNGQTNPDLNFKVVDKKNRLCEIIIDIHPLSAMLFK